MGKNLHKIYLTYYNLFIAHGLWLTHYQILSIIITDIMIKKVKHADLYINIAIAFLNTETLKMI